jgi:phosphodiesterase/alkaline phosphatase D-like protein
MKRRLLSLIIGLLLAFTTACQQAQAPVTDQKPAVSTQLRMETQTASVFDGAIILGRPTNTSMTASITAGLKNEVYLQWGAQSGTYAGKSEIKTATSIAPAVIVMDQLSPDQDYYYSLYFRQKTGDEFKKTAEYNFHTPRSEGKAYNFVVQSDSHLLNKADPDLYKQSMLDMAGLDPDFMFDLGDTFLNDQTKGNAIPSYESIAATYRQQLPYFDLVTRCAPLFLTIGNHEGEYGSFFDATKENLAARSTIARTTYFPNPVPDTFYSGNEQTEELLGNPQNYYAFTWGDALFVSIDPYRYSTVIPYGDESGSDGWAWTLGKSQYDWFRSTLENSKVKYKFVFSHHAIGNFRGGEQIAKLYEWGGYDKKGTYLFDQKRPGWGKPIQQIMKDAQVTIFFQGHDHLFAREIVDGIVYQTLPKPAEVTADSQSNFKAYPHADVLLNSGYLNVLLKDGKVQVDYHRNYFVSSESQENNVGVVYSYTVDEQHQVQDLISTKDVLENYGRNPESSSASTTASAEITAVPPGGFSFAIQADSHLDEKTDTALYSQTIANIKNASPSFVIDLGDTFMAEKLAKNQAEVESRYLLAKGYFDGLGSIPLYLVTGNHDGENGFDSSRNEMMTWARNSRLEYFPFPAGTTGFSGNVTTANYYTLIKGNAQFFVLDPYTFSTQKVGQSGNGWVTTLGETQYNWLKNELEASQAEFKFVLVHNLVGGIGKDQRGGAEAAEFFEWGGANGQGAEEFPTMRPGWELPIHDLLVKYNVNAVFHGHDHFYARQEKDGIIYQLVPQPGTPGNSVNDATSYGYESGTFLPSAGYLRVVVASDDVTVEYVKSGSDGKMSIPDAYVLK